ncbi:MAG: polyribonucleotide nucleotidyltransferase, partial [Proteobacteria bacterium]
MSVIKEAIVGDKTIRFEFNKFAKQANGSVMVSCGDTQVLVTVCAADAPKEGQDFFPLSVDYIEKYYAAGRIPGGFVKREGRLSELETLTSRLIDRPLRPCFPEGYLNDTQVIATVMSLDPLHHPSSLALAGASVALMISDIPFNGPVASLRIGRKDGKLIIDPLPGDDSDLELVVAATPDAVLMVEAAAKFLSEAEMIDAIAFAQKSMKPIHDLQLEIQKEIGKAKKDLVRDANADALYAKAQGVAGSLVKDALVIKEK